MIKSRGAFLNVRQVVRIGPGPAYQLYGIMSPLQHTAKRLASIHTKYAQEGGVRTGRGTAMHDSGMACRHSRIRAQCVPTSRESALRKPHAWAWTSKTGRVRTSNSRAPTYHSTPPSVEGEGECE